jgi:hypothetical protein
MLGFALGALFVLALPRRQVPPERPNVPRPPVTALTPARVTTVEAVFAEWGKYAMWERDVTQIALWNSDTAGFTDAFEVVRLGENLYFRSIPRLSRPLLTHGVPSDSPLEFTETEEQRQQWLKETAQESWKALQAALPGSAPAKPSP